MKTVQTPLEYFVVGRRISNVVHLSCGNSAKQAHIDRAFFFLLFLEMVSPLYVPKRENLVSKKGA